MEDERWRDQSMSEKVKLPQRVVDAIEYYSRPELGYTKYGVLDNILGDGSAVACLARGALKEKFGDGPCWDVLMKAIVNGYEVEKTRDERIKQEYDLLRRDEKLFPEKSQWYHGRQLGMKDTLDILGVKIEGVNS